MVTCFDMNPFPAGGQVFATVTANISEYITNIRIVDWNGNIITGGINYMVHLGKDPMINHYQVLGGNSSTPGDIIAYNDTVMSDTSGDEIGKIKDIAPVGKLYNHKKATINGRVNEGLFAKLKYAIDNKLNKTATTFTPVKKATTIKPTTKNGGSAPGDITQGQDPAPGEEGGGGGGGY